MTNVTSNQGELVISIQATPALWFEVRTGLGDDAPGYVGYCNGLRSVAASQADVALRGLGRKHLPKKVLDMAEWRERLRSAPRILTRTTD